MDTLYYSIVGIIAILIHLVINYDIIKKPAQSEVQKTYKRFIVSLITYYIIDILWGFFAATHNTSILYVDTVLYYIAATCSVILWSKYAISYLQFKSHFGKFLKGLGIFFGIAAITFLIINHFNHILFWIDEKGSYQSYLLRYVSMTAQILLFMATAIEALWVASKSKGAIRGRHLTIALFGIIMTTAVILQTLHPLVPIYTMGLLIGTCVLHVFVHEDEKEEFRNKLAENNQVIAAAGYGIWKFTFDENGEVSGLIGNEKWMEIFGATGKDFTPEERLNYYKNGLTPKSAEEVKDDYAEMRDGSIKTRIFEWNHPTKGIIHLSVGGTRLQETDGSIAISGFIGDVTAEKIVQDQLNASLEQAKKQAEEASLAKSKFLFNMSHDIRTPMNAIIGFTNLMKKNLDNKEKMEDYLAKCQSSSDFLLSLINNVLEMARIESGKISLAENVIDTQKFEDVTDAVFTDLARQKGLTFSNEYQLKHKYVIGDEMKIREITLNIVSNSIKYTAPGGFVKLHLCETGCEKPGYTTFVAVAEDSGIGISKEFLPHVFEEFSREKNSTDSKIAGTGLGMPIVKKLIDLMGGTISIQSEVNKGTTITVTIPLRIATEEEAKAANNTTPIKEEKFAIQNPDLDDSAKEAQFETERATLFTGKSILLAEDNDLNAEIAMAVLEDMGFKVVRASDGVKCVSIMEQYIGGYFDLILMDIQMPRKNGYQAAMEIRSMQDKSKANIPIIAMTANAFDEDRQKSFKAGMNGHIAKPIDVQILEKSIAEVLT